jgi:DSF synthase
MLTPRSCSAADERTIPPDEIGAKLSAPASARNTPLLVAVKETVIMFAVETLSRSRPFRQIRVEETEGTATYWCYMHAGARLPGAGVRPCFTNSLLTELKQLQNDLAFTVARGAAGPDAPAISHLVLASDADVFNLGGDLDLFVKLIREGDRERLFQYARTCVEVAYGFHRLAGDAVHSVAVVQGDALGGGFEAALCCHTIIAESGVGMGFPEVLFDLFPGMGAYSYLSKRVPPIVAERMMLDGRVYTTDELHKLGVVDILVPKGQGLDAARELIKRDRRIGHARRAMNQVRSMVTPVTLEELTRVTTIWVDTAMQLGPKALGTMERLVRAQLRRSGGVPENVSAISQAS